MVSLALGHVGRAGGLQHDAGRSLVIVTEVPRMGRQGRAEG